MRICILNYLINKKKQLLLLNNNKYFTKKSSKINIINFSDYSSFSKDLNNENIHINNRNT